jgi:N4-gp56 family major capsid protein
MSLWYDSGDPEVVNVWEKDLDREVRARSPLFDPRNGLAGKSRSNLIQLKDDLTAQAGRNIRTKLRYQLKGRGRAGQETLKGHLGAYKTATFDIVVEKIRWGHETSDEIVDQWVTEDSVEEGRDGLADWFATRFEFSGNLHAAGFSIITDAAYNLNNTIKAPHADYLIRPGNVANAESLTSAHKFDLDLVNKAVRRIKNVRPKIRPAQTPWGPRYCCFLHPNQVSDLHESDSLWFQTMQNAIKGGRVDDNPLFSHMLGEWDGVLFFESDWVPPGISSTSLLQEGTRRAWIGGAQALFLAFGRGRAPSGYALNRYRWENEKEDFGNIYQVAAITITGMAKPQYKHPDEATARDYGVVVLETYAAQDVDTEYDDWLDAGAPT